MLYYPTLPCAVLHNWLFTSFNFPSQKHQRSRCRRLLLRSDTASLAEATACVWGDTVLNPSSACKRPLLDGTTPAQHPSARGCLRFHFRIQVPLKRRRARSLLAFLGKKALPAPDSTDSPLSQPTQLASLDFNDIVNRTADVPKNKAAFSLSNLTSQIDLMKRIHHTKTRCPSLISSMGQAGAHEGFNCHSLHRRFLRCVCGLELVCAVRQLS